MRSRDGLNHVDLCFVVDTTGSMGPFIQAAQRHLLDTIEALRDGGIDLHVGLVEYRDHPPQENTFITRVGSGLTADLKAMRKAIRALAANGGGDAPEAVFDGVDAASARMQWRPHSCRFILLVGDAPPHGALAHEGKGDPCPCGRTAHSVTAAAEERRVTVHALCMVGDAFTTAAFERLAGGTGGQCVPAVRADKVVETIREMLAREFRDLELDARTLEAARGEAGLDVDALARTLDRPRLQIAASLARLGKRGFLTDFR